MVEGGAPAPDIRVRKAVVEDQEIIADMQCAMAMETENKQLNRELVKQAVQRITTNPKWGFYLMAWDENDPEKKLVGTTLLTILDMNVALGGLIYMINSVYVCPEGRRKGIFRALYNSVVEAARADPMAKCVRLYVEHDNY